MAPAVTIVPMSRGAVLRLAPSADALAAAAASEVLASIEAALAWRGEAHLALAGGRTPAALYRALASLRFDGWTHVHVWFGDERTVPPDHDDSNWRMARDTLLHAVSIPEAQVHRMAGELDPASAAARYDEELRALARTQHRDAPTFDVLLLGMGADAHTASLFPGSPLLQQGTENRERATGNRQPGAGNGEAGTGNRQPGTGSREPATSNRERVTGDRVSAPGPTVGSSPDTGARAEPIDTPFAAAVHVPAMDTWRLTVTPATIRAARTVFVLVSGVDKHAALRRAIGADTPLAEAPVTLLHDVPGDVAWFVDRAALFGS